MKRASIYLVLIYSLVCWFGYAEAKDSVEESHIMLKLSDGSCIIGSSSMDGMSIKTDYAKLEIPFNLIQSIQFGIEDESDCIRLTNGDRVSGKIKPGKMKLETLFGRVSVDLDLVRHLDNVSGSNLEIEALIDGDTELHVTRNGIYWKTFGLAKPGRHEGQNEATWVNGVAWFPQWRQPEEERGEDQSELFPMKIGPLDNYRFELLAVGPERGSQDVEDRGAVTIDQNEDELVVSIPDGQGGSSWYRFRLYMEN